MRKLTLCVIALLASASPALAQMGGGGGGGMSGMQMGGAPDSAPADDTEHAKEIGSSDRGTDMKPLGQDQFDKAVTAMFAAADTNRDGLVTLAELEAIVQARRDQIIRDRFKEIDTNHDGRIDADEFTVWQNSMGAAASSACAGTVGATELVPETLGPPLGRSDRDMMLGVAIEPLSANVITAANIHYRPGITLADLLAYEDAHFHALDTNKDGFLEQQELNVAGRPRGGPGGIGGAAGGGMGGHHGGMGGGRGGMGGGGMGGGGGDMGGPPGGL